jgi:putative intracellular protease/amidase
MKKLLLLAILILVLPACTIEKKLTTGQDVSPKAALLLAPVDFSGQQYRTVSGQLAALGVDVRVFSIQSIKAQADDDSEVAAEALYDGLPNDVDLLVVIGGPGMSFLAEDNALAAAIIAFSQAGKPVGFLAEGRQLLDKSGLRLIAAEPTPSPAGAIIEAVDVTTVGPLVSELMATRQK